MAAMRLSKLITPDLNRTVDEEPALLPALLEEVHAEDVAEILLELSAERAEIFIRALPTEKAAEVLERLPEDVRVRLIADLGPADSTELVTEMDVDDRVDLVQELPHELRQEVMAAFAEAEPELARELRVLTNYDEDTAGGLMTTEYLALWPELTVAEAIDEVRASRDRDLETIYYLYVVAYDKLVGVLSLRDLILADPDTLLCDVMTEKVVSVDASLDQEEVARKFAKYDMSALPVVDEQGGMLGVVTIDDAVDVVIEEATEDTQMMAGIVPMEESYFHTGFFEFMRSRVTWLIVLFVGELLTANVMNAYEHQLAMVMNLVLFIPLIISSGGNSGSQSSSLIIRGLALGEILPSDWPRVFARELGMGLALGSILGAVGFIRAFLGHGIEHPLAMGGTVAVSIVAVVTVGTLVGSLMPLLIQRVGFDPAVSSTPFVASLVDVLGLVVYFSVAKALFAAVLASAAVG